MNKSAVVDINKLDLWAHNRTLTKLRCDERVRNIAVLKEILTELAEVDMPEYFSARVEMAIEFTGRIA
jgi:hypothetical protein